MTHKQKCIIFWLSSAGQPDGNVSGIWLNSIWRVFVDKQQLKRPRLEGAVWNSSADYSRLHSVIKEELSGLVEYEARSGAYNLKTAGCANGLGVFKTFDEWAGLLHAYGFRYRLTRSGWINADKLDDDDKFWNKYEAMFPDGKEFDQQMHIDESGVVHKAGAAL